MNAVEYWYPPPSMDEEQVSLQAHSTRNRPWLPIVDHRPAPVSIAVRAVDSVGELALSELVQRCPPPQADGRERRTVFEVRLGRQVTVRLMPSDVEVGVVTVGHRSPAVQDVAGSFVALSFLHRSLISIDVHDVEAAIRSAAQCFYVTEPIAGWTDLRRAAFALADRATAIVIRHHGRATGLPVATSDEAWEPHLGALSAASEIVGRCVADVESHVFPVIPMVLPVSEPRGLSLLLFLSTPE